MTQPSFGQCIRDDDWPEKPCLDTPPYSKSDLKEVWQKYYDLKGKEWMEMKKAEMDQAIRDGTLKEWVEYHGDPNNFANYNVYFYYYLNDQAPDAYGNSFFRDDSRPVITYWYASPAGMATIAGIGLAAIAALYVFRKARRKH
jgi:hypothetical protein